MIFIRRLPQFDYVAPRTLWEASSVLAERKSEAVLMAGGTDLLPKMKKREATPRYLVSLKNVPGLAYIKEDKGALKIGPMATIHDVESSPVIAGKYAILRDTSLVFASAQIRNLATVTGNLCNAAPSADMASPLIALGATLSLSGPQGGRTIPLEKFFTGPFTNSLGEGELVAEIQAPQPQPHTGGVYIKHSIRNAMDHAIVGVAVVLTLDGSDVCKDVRIALGACAPTPVRAAEAEKALKGNKLTKAAIDKAAKAAVSAAQPRSDPEYKREMVQVLTARALNQAWQIAR
ncbi:MAG: xanthine dehydrogenase family protein subunit M [Chloroflexi bacterium]|nr:xanthine dehydrogenase family protein subunit M [Chloroflexota bacterium]